MNRFTAALLTLPLLLSGCDAVREPAGPLPSASYDPGTVLVVGSGNNQMGSIGIDTLPKLLKVRVQGPDKTPVPDAIVTWTVATGGGSLRRARSRTNDQGVASNAWHPGPSLGLQTVTAAVEGLGDVTFTAEIVNGPAISDITITPGRVITITSAQTATVTFKARDHRGVNFGEITLFEGAHNRGLCGTYYGTITATPGGTAEEQQYECIFTIPANTAPTVFTARVEARNAAGDTTLRNAPRQLIRNDFEPPVLSEIRVVPNGVDARFGEDFPTPVTVRWRATDTVGVADNQLAELWLVPPPGCTVGCSETVTHSCTPTRISGTPNNGVYRCTVEVRALTYEREVRILTIDKSGNWARVNTGYKIIPGD